MKILSPISTISVLLGSLLILSCEKGNYNKPAPPPFQSNFSVNDGVFVYEGEMMANVEVLDPATIRIKTSMPEQYRPPVGSIIFCSVSNRAPAGFLGRVESIEGDVYNTSPAELEEAFKELHIDDEIDLAPYVCEFKDKDGEGISGSEIVEGDIWNDFGDKEDSEAPQTKAGEWTTLQTVSWPFVAGEGFSGTLFVQSKLFAKIDIVDGKEIRRSFIIRRRSGIRIGMEYEWKEETDYSLISKDGVLPPVVIANVLSVRPHWEFEAGFKIQGRTYVKGEIGMEVENAAYSIVLEDGHPAFDVARNPGNQYFTVAEFESEAGIGPYMKAGLELGIYDRRAMSVGIKAEGVLMAKAETAFSLSDESLLVKNPTVKLQPQLDVFLYVYTFLTSWWDKWTGDTYEMEGKRGYHYTPELPVFEMPLLPMFSGTAYRRTDGNPSVKTELNAHSFMPALEQGFAFYISGSDEPVAQVPVTNNDTPTSTASYDGDADYAKPYVKSADGDVYYGDPVWSKRITELHMSNGDSEYLKYDEEGRIKEHSLYRNSGLLMIYRFSYSDDTIVKTTTTYNGNNGNNETSTTTIQMVDGRAVTEKTGSTLNRLAYDVSGNLISSSSTNATIEWQNGDFVAKSFNRVTSDGSQERTFFTYSYTDQPNPLSDAPFDATMLFGSYSFYDFYGNRASHLPYAFYAKYYENYEQRYVYSYGFDDLGRPNKISFVRTVNSYRVSSSPLGVSYNSADFNGYTTIIYE